MDIPTLTPGAASIQTDESQRVKFLCSFSGSILPRPQDGKLRYVGGETRIISVPRDITYEDLMLRMRELFESATVLKYQQPDEDLDALVSVVNDDDVTNMMEEYDKVGSGDGFTRLRLFLFTSPEQDGSSLHFGLDGDEREHERRYVDALNSLNESPDFRKNTTEFDDMHGAETYFNPMSLDGGGVHGLRNNNNNNINNNNNNNSNMELPMAQMNLRHLTIPHLGSSGQMEAPWSPAYYSPRLPEFPTSPSSSRYRPTPYEQPQYSDSNVVLMPTNNDKAGFPGNVLQVPPSVCENCRITFQRNQVYAEPPPPPLPQLEPLPSNVGGSNGYFQIPNNSCAECVPNPNNNPSREVFILNSDPNLHHPQYYCRDNQNDPRPVYSESQCHDRGWVSPHQPNPWAEGYVMDNGMNINVCDGHHHYIHHDDHQRYGSQVHLPSLEDRGPRYGHPPPTYKYGGENAYQVPTHGHIPPQSPWRNVHNSPFQVGPPHEESVSSQLVNSSVLPMGFVRETSPMLRSSVENQIPWTQPSQKVVGFDHVQAVKPTPNAQALENYQNDAETNTLIRVNGSDTDKNLVMVISNVQEPVFENGAAVSETNVAGLDEDKSDDRLEFLPELIASVKEAALENLKVVKDKVQEDTDSGSAENHKDGVDDNVELEVEDDTCKVDQSKIERTKAEEEAIDRGLQTIRNEDLEEIRELGSGTYGSVYHGKWKGSDVAIKRIKASCFAGRPSERERLIADFWKEALILSSLHHPNVVSFYGVVRDGPDGSLATVTEFMVNGSLKQFLQKKDRTIDRRKRLIIAMDTAFGMEYLHGKNIVHFDLKCENLLVNMRDPHRPVCKVLQLPAYAGWGPSDFVKNGFDIFGREFEVASLFLDTRQPDLGDLGLSKVKQHTLVSGGVRGTLPWMAPELLSGKSNMVTEKIDVYSFGICMWELLTGDEPYTDMHCANIIGGIVNNTLRPQIPTWCDPEWKAMMEGCWASEPAQRPSFSEIAQKLRNMAAAMNLK